MIYTYNKMRTHSQQLTTTAWQDRIRMGGCVQKSISPFFSCLIANANLLWFAEEKYHLKEEKKK